MDLRTDRYVIELEPTVVRSLTVPVSSNQLSNTTPNVTPVEIPLELIDNIMDHLHDDKHTLTRSSLVCRAWLPSTRYHLFRSVFLQSHTAGRFLALVDSPHCTILNFVRNLRIDEGAGRFVYDSKWVNNAIPVLARLFAVESLEIWHWSWENLGANEKAIFLSGFKQVKALDLSNVHLKTFEQALELLSAFPALEKLSLESVTWDRASSSEPASTVITFPLRTLELGSCHKTHVLNWLLSQHGVGLVEALHLHKIQSGELPLIDQLLRATNTSLRHIELGFGSLNPVSSKCAFVALSSPHFTCTHLQFL